MIEKTVYMVATENKFDAVGTVLKEFATKEEAEKFEKFVKFEISLRKLESELGVNFSINEHDRHVFYENREKIKNFFEKISE